MGKPVFKLAPLGNEQLFDLTAPDLRVPGIPDDAFATGHLSSQPAGSESHGQCVTAAPSLPSRFAAWRIGAPLFEFSLFGGAMQIAIFLARCLTLQDSAPRYRKGSQCECGRPHDTLSCHFFTALCLGQGFIHIDASTTNQRY